MLKICVTVSTQAGEPKRYKPNDIVQENSDVRWHGIIFKVFSGFQSSSRAVRLILEWKAWLLGYTQPLASYLFLPGTLYNYCLCYLIFVLAALQGLFSGLSWLLPSVQQPKCCETKQLMDCIVRVYLYKTGKQHVPSEWLANSMFHQGIAIWKQFVFVELLWLLSKR